MTLLVPQIDPSVPQPVVHIGDPGLLLFGGPVFTEPILIF